jgi:ADP-ribose pyrophosphatase YjhB (NUDIX family)
MIPDDEVKFCPRCGTALEARETGGKLRPVCPACGFVVFFDPKVAAVALVERGGKVLLVRRVMNPEQGKWTLPGGFVDAGEDPRLAAVRECREETGLAVEITGLLDVVYSNDHPRGASIVLAYQARLLGGDLSPSDDADRAGFFAPDELPEIAFEATRVALAKWHPGVTQTMKFGT